VLVNSGEVKDPEKNLPFALLLAALIIAAIYMLVQIVSIGTLPSLASTDKPLAEAAKLFAGKPGAMVIALGAMFSVAGTIECDHACRFPIAICILARKISSRKFFHLFIRNIKHLPGHCFCLWP
jgi:amino acid transporter